MSAKKEGRAVDVSFGEWLEMACKHDPLAWKQLLGAILLMFCAFLLSTQVPIVGIPLLLGVGFAFALAFRHAWKLALKNPPWWMAKVQDK